MNSKANNSTQLSWNSSYKLDIPMIDKQHIIFFKLFDKLTLLNKDEVNYNKLSDVIDELEKYTHNHFNTEEALMKKANSPDIDSHVLQHQIFIKKVGEFKIAYNYKNAILLEQMIVFMRKWFLMHISEIDKKYTESVQKFLERKE